MKTRMLIFVSIAVFLGLMVGNAAAQSTVTCTGSGNVYLGQPKNAVDCTENGTLFGR